MKCESSVMRYEAIEGSVLTNGDVMKHEHIIAKRTKYDSMFAGDKWYHSRHERCFLFL